jgi:hypothetical protein
MELGDASATTVGDGATPGEASASQVEAPISQLKSTCTQYFGSTPDRPPLPPKGKKPIETGRRVSPVCNHFDKIDYPDGCRVAICKYC